MFVSGVPEVTDRHARKVANCSLDMVVVVQEVTSPATGKPIQVRMIYKSGFQCIYHDIYSGPINVGLSNRTDEPLKHKRGRLNLINYRNREVNLPHKSRRVRMSRRKGLLFSAS